MAENTAQIVVQVKNLTSEAFQAITNDLKRLEGQASATGQQTAAGMAKAGAASKEAQGAVDGLMGAFGRGASGPVDQLKAKLTSLAEEGLGQLTQRTGLSRAALLDLAVGAGVTVGALAALGAALKAAVEYTVETGSELHRMSLITGISVEGLSKLQYATTVTGESMATLTNATFMLQRRLGEDSPEFERGLKAIGLTLQDLQGQQPDEMLLRVSDAMRSTGDSTAIATAAFGLFGRQGRELLPLLLEELRDLTVEAEQNGSTWTKAQADMAESVEHAEGRITASWNRIKKSAGGTILPIVAALLEWVTKAPDAKEVSPSLRLGAPAPDDQQRLLEEIGKQLQAMYGGAAAHAPSLPFFAAPTLGPLPIPDSERTAMAWQAFTSTGAAALSSQARQMALAMFQQGGTASRVSSALGAAGIAGATPEGISGLYDTWKTSAAAAKKAMDEANAAHAKAISQRLDLDEAASAQAKALADADLAAWQADNKASVDAGLERYAAALEADQRLYALAEGYQDKTRALYATGTDYQLRQLDIEEKAQIAQIRAARNAGEAAKAAAIASTKALFDEQRKLIRESHGDWIDYFSQLETAAQTLAQSQRAGVAAVGLGLVTIASGLKTTLQMDARIALDLKALKSGTVDTDKAVIQLALDLAQAAANAVAAFAAISDSSSRAMNTLHGVLGGLQLGASIGSIVPGLGTALGGGLGALVGGLAGLFHSAADELRSTQQQVDQFIQSQGGIEQLTASVQQFGLTMDYVNRMIATTPGIAMLAQELSEDQKILDAAVSAGKGFADMVAGWATPLTDASAHLSDLQSQLASATDASSYAATWQQIQALQATVADLGAASSQSAAEFQHLTEEGEAAFAAMLRSGSSLTDAMAAMGDSFKTLVTLQEQFGFKVDAGSQKVLDFYKAVTGNADTVRYLSGLSAFITGIGGSMTITPAMASDWGAQLQAAHDQLKAGDVSEADILLMMQGPLQAVWEQSQQQLLPLDGSLKTLVDEALAQGLIGEDQKSVAEQQLDVLVDIKNAVIGITQEWQQQHGGLSGPGTAGGGGGGTQTNTSFSWTSPISTGVSNFSYPGTLSGLVFGPSGWGSGYTGATDWGTLNGVDYQTMLMKRNHFAAGSNGFRDFGPGEPAVLHGLEAVMRPMDLAQVVAVAGGGGGRGGAGGDRQPIVLMVNGQAFGQAVVDLGGPRLQAMRLTH